MEKQLKYIFKLFCASSALSLMLASSVNGASLWLSSTNNERSIFADIQASRKGDILTLISNESLQLDLSDKTSVERTGAVDNKVTSFLFPAANSGLGKHNGALPETSIATSKSHSGTGSISKGVTITARASVVVTDVLPNGNLVVEGGRVVSFANQTYYAVLRGIVRPNDISRDVDGSTNNSLKNMIYSQYVADAQVEYIPKGSMATASKQPFMQRVLDKISPF